MLRFNRGFLGCQISAEGISGHRHEGPFSPSRKSMSEGRRSGNGDIREKKVEGVREAWGGGWLLPEDERPSTAYFGRVNDFEKGIARADACNDFARRTEGRGFGRSEGMVNSSL